MITGRQLFCPMPILSLLLHYAVLFSSQAIELTPRYAESSKCSQRSQTHNRVSLAFTATPLSSTVQEKIRQAASLSSQSNANATLAKEASVIWSSILSSSDNDVNDDCLQLSDNIQAIGYAMYASCLARIGRDVDAVSAFDRALQLRQFLTDGSISEAMMGRAYALQRLMRYEEAKNQFSNCAQWSHEKNFAADTVAKAICYAATCAMRLDRLDAAKDELAWYCDVARDNSESTIEGCEAMGMLGAVLWMDSFRTQQMKNNNESHITKEAIEKLQYASEMSNTALYRWLYHLANKSSLKSSLPSTKSSAPKLKSISKEGEGEDLILDLAAANRSPFDDPGTINLDDKVLLHRLLTYENNKASKTELKGETNLGMDTSLFWPTSFILPQQSAELESYISLVSDAPNKEHSKHWILKDRAGYGSHGNRLVTHKEALNYAMKMTDDSESLLCQQLVDPPLLINGRKFSLRVYVVCIPDGAIAANGTYGQFLISTQGLVKLASLQYDNGVNSSGENDKLFDDMHMTNSGRGDGVTMDQCDFQFLKEELGRMGYKYDKFWEEIKQVVISVMKRYNNRPGNFESKTKLNKSSKAIFCLPKILGLDFILDAKCHPMLIEVNRFPGLKPRDDSDATVKHQIVMDAWYETLKATDSSCAIVGLKERDMLQGSSLQRIDV